MYGHVDIIWKGEVVQSDSNLITDLFSTLMVDILTANPSLSAIPSASAILDASNYTIQALTFGKGTQDYQNHAHNINVSAGAVASGCIAVIRTSGGPANSYQGEHLNLKSVSYPSPMDSRVERKTTLPPFANPLLNSDAITLLSAYDFDQGHMLNAIHGSATNGLGASSVLIGCYPAASDGAVGGGTDYKLLNETGTEVSGGVFLSKYNHDNVMDSSGFITMTVSSADEGNILNAAATTPTNTPSGIFLTANLTGSWSGVDGVFSVTTQVSAGDLGAAAMYGGIWAAGLWALDLKTLLADGKNPPYAFSPLNNLRKYRLILKKVFTKPITYHQDSESGDGLHPTGGLKSFESDLGLGSFHAFLNTLGLIWTIRL